MKYGCDIFRDYIYSYNFFSRFKHKFLKEYFYLLFYLDLQIMILIQRIVIARQECG